MPRQAWQTKHNQTLYNKTLTIERDGELKQVMAAYRGKLLLWWHEIPAED